MIGKAQSISHASNAINYAMEKKGAVEISRNKVAGEKGKEIAKEFRVFQKLNARCQRNTISFVLSPSIPVGNQLKNEDFRNLSDDFLSRMNLEENQSITFLHRDEDHLHLHIFVNRIDYNGRAYKDHFISKKAQRIAESMAKARGYKTAKECGVSTSEYSRRAAMNMKVTLRFSPEELEVYNNLHAYHRNFKSIGNLIKSKHFYKNDMILYELGEVIKLIKNHLGKFEQ